MAVEIVSTPIDGVFELKSTSFIDNRGSFINAFRIQELNYKKAWGERSIAQINISKSEQIGTVRGLHLQSEPHSEAKIIRCLSGMIWDVAIDLRKDSPTMGKWHAVELSPDRSNALVIPEGCAHGFQVLKQNSRLLYIHSGAWVPESETGVNIMHPQLAINWPLAPLALSERDKSLPMIDLYA